jgi:putative aldouronate transport system permease protein
MLDSLSALIIPVAVSTYNVFVMRNFISSLPESLPESARIDGANEFQILLRIIVPLSKPAMAVLGLMYAVGHWNSWFSCLIYISSTDKYTLQPILRQILFSMGAANYYGYDPSVTEAAMPMIVQMSAVIVATLPILCVYPFLQKYFIKGVMLGAVKG